MPRTRPRSALCLSDPRPLRITCPLGVIRTPYFECSAPFGAHGKANCFGRQFLRRLRLKTFRARFACSEAAVWRRRPLRHGLLPPPRASPLFFMCRLAAVALSRRIMIDGMYAARWHRDLMYVIELASRSQPKWFRENAVTHHVQPRAGSVLLRRLASLLASQVRLR